MSGRPHGTAWLTSIAAALALAVLVGSVSRNTATRWPAEWPLSTGVGRLFVLAATAFGLLSAIAAAFLIVRNRSRSGAERALFLMTLMAGSGAAWSEVLARNSDPGFSFSLAVVTWILTGWTVGLFWSVRDLAGVLLGVYWAYTTGMIAVTAAIWRATR